MYWIAEAFRNSFDFSGRACRSEYWVFTAASAFVGMTLAVIDSLLGLRSRLGIGLFEGIFYALTFITGLSVTVRRLHDVDCSGWWLIALAVPYVLFEIAAQARRDEAALLAAFLFFISFVTFIVITARKGIAGDNEYGPNPLDF